MKKIFLLILAGCFMCTTPVFGDITTGLVGRYEFENCNGPVVDTSGNGNDGVIVGEIQRCITGIKNNAFEWVDQGANRVELPFFLNNSSFSVSMWFYYDPLFDYSNPNRSSLFGGWTTSDGGKDGWWASVATGGKINVGYYYNNSLWEDLITTIASHKGWNHLVVTFEDGRNPEIRVFLNNQEAGSRNLSVFPDRHDEMLFIGMHTKYQGVPPNYICFKGAIDEVRVYDIAITEIIIEQLYYESLSIEKPYTFVSGTPAKASEVNANFDILYLRINEMYGIIDALQARVKELENSVSP